MCERTLVAGVVEEPVHDADPVERGFDCVRIGHVERGHLGRHAEPGGLLQRLPCGRKIRDHNLRAIRSQPHGRRPPDVSGRPRDEGDRPAHLTASLSAQAFGIPGRSTLTTAWSPHA